MTPKSAKKMMMNHIEMRKYEFHLTIPGEIPLKKYYLASSRLCPLPNVFSNSSSPRNPFQDWNPLPKPLSFSYIFSFLSFAYENPLSLWKTISECLLKPTACVFISIGAVPTEDSSSLQTLRLIHQKSHFLNFQKSIHAYHLESLTSSKNHMKSTTFSKNFSIR